MAWKLHAIEQTQLRRHHRVEGVRRLKFDFHTGGRSSWLTVGMSDNPTTLV